MLVPGPEPYVVAFRFGASALPGSDRRERVDPCLALGIFGTSPDPFCPEGPLGGWPSPAQWHCSSDSLLHSRLGPFPVAIVGHSVAFLVHSEVAAVVAIAAWPSEIAVVD